VEAWACSNVMEGVGNEEEKKDGLCREMKVARWLLVPVLVASLGMLGLVVWDWLVGREKEVIRTEDVEVGNKTGKFRGSV
jgi:hypothetical protein